MASTPIFPKTKPTYINTSTFCLTLKLLCTLVFSQEAEVPLFLPRQLLLLCSWSQILLPLQGLSSKPLFDTSSCISKFSLYPGPSSLSTYIFRFPPAPKHSLYSATSITSWLRSSVFCYIYIIFSEKQRSFTANLFERGACILSASSSSPFTHVNTCTLVCGPTIQRNYVLQGHQYSPKHEIHSLFSVTILLNLSIVSDTMISLHEILPWPL